MIDFDTMVLSVWEYATPWTLRRQSPPSIVTRYKNSSAVSVLDARPSRGKKGGVVSMPRPRLSRSDYSALAELRYVLRRFLDFSEKAARKAGLTPRQHQALLVIKGYRGGEPISIGDLAERLIIHHHSAVELANRLVESGLVVRLHDENDQRRVLLCLTERANACLEELSGAHLDELSRIGPLLGQFFEEEGGRTKIKLSGSA
jgi:DNA-binding MarR family transcriptional regulator